MMGSDDLLAIFVAGNAFTWDDWFRIKTENSHLQEVIDMIFTTTFFIYFGLTIPWHSFVSGSLSILNLFLFAFFILFLSRPPVIVALFKFVPAIENIYEAMFVGWLGPVGLDAVFYACYAKRKLEADLKYDGWVMTNMYPIVAWLVLCSVVVHGIMVPMVKTGKMVGRPMIKTISRSFSISHELSKCEKKKSPSFMDRLLCRNTGNEVSEKVNISQIRMHHARNNSLIIVDWHEDMTLAV